MFQTQVHHLPEGKNSMIDNYKNIFAKHDEKLQRLIKQICIPIFRSTSFPNFLILTCTVDDTFDFFVKILNTYLQELNSKQFDVEIKWANTKVF